MYWLLEYYSGKTVRKSIILNISFKLPVQKIGFLWNSQTSQSKIRSWKNCWFIYICLFFLTYHLNISKGYFLELPMWGNFSDMYVISEMVKMYICEHLSVGRMQRNQTCKQAAEIHFWWFLWKGISATGGTWHGLGQNFFISWFTGNFFQT